MLVGIERSGGSSRAGRARAHLDGALGSAFKREEAARFSFRWGCRDALAGFQGIVSCKGHSTPRAGRYSPSAGDRPTWPFVAIWGLMRLLERYRHGRRDLRGVLGGVAGRIGAGLAGREA